MQFTKLKRDMMRRTLPPDIVQRLIGEAPSRQALAKDEQKKELATYGLDQEEEDEDERPVLPAGCADPVAIAAIEMLGDALKNEPSLKRLLRMGEVTAIVVPDRAWVAPVTDLLVDLVERAKRPRLADEIRPWSSRLPDLILPQTREVPVKSRAAEEERKTALAAASFRVGSPIVLVATDPAELMPEEVLPLITRTITLGTLTPSQLRQVIRIVTGRDGGSIPIELSSLVTPTTLALAVRSTSRPAEAVRALSLLHDRREKTSDLPSLDDLFGMPGLRRWARETKADLNAYRAGLIAWEVISRGVLVSGPPGVGKTYSARIIAHFLGLRLVAASVAKWLSHKDGDLGDFCAAVRATFAEAREGDDPVLLVVDEVDAIPARGASGARGHSWWAAALTALLNELDGLEARGKIIVMAMCNHVHRLDPALVRPGRFDRMIEIGLPDVPDLEGILRVCCRPDLQEADLRSVAARLAGASAATIAQIVRDARRRARGMKRDLQVGDLEAVIAETRPPLAEAARRRIAIHEAAHAVIALAHGHEVSRIELTPGSSESTGATEIEHSRNFAGTLPEIEAHVSVLLAGRAAEEVLVGEASASAGADLEEATRFLTRMLGDKGLGRSLRWRGETERLNLIQVSGDLGAEVEEALQRIYARTCEEIRENHAAIERLARALVDQSWLKREAILEILGAPPTGNGTAHGPAPASPEHDPASPSRPR